MLEEQESSISGVHVVIETEAVDSDSQQLIVLLFEVWNRHYYQIVVDKTADGTKTIFVIQQRYLIQK